MEFKAEPYTLRLSPNSPETEKDFRENLNVSWCNAVLFNVEAVDNRATIAEYDAILWNEKKKEILFIEYKNSTSAKKNLKESRAQQIKASSRNIARAFGFARYNFIVVVKDNKGEGKKGTAKVFPLEEMPDFVPTFESTIEELDYVNTLLGKYDRTENQVEFSNELAIKELRILKDKIKQVNS